MEDTTNTLNLIGTSTASADNKPIEKATEAAVPREKPVGLMSTTSFLDPTVWSQMGIMASAFRRSNALGSNENEFTLMMKFQAGIEMGMSPIESIKSFYFVNGNINIFGAALMKRLRTFGWSISYVDENNKCTVTVTTDEGSKQYSDSLTFEEAEQSGWTKTKTGAVKDNWLPGANRKLKLRYGAVSMLIKSYLPEVLGSATDIAEVAMDYLPTESGRASIPEAADANEPINDTLFKTLAAMGGNMDRDYTNDEARKLIRELGPKKAVKNV